MGSPPGGSPPAVGALDAIHSINQRIFDTVLDLILVVDRAGRTLCTSPSSSTILGRSPEEMIQRPASDLIHQGDLARTKDEMRLARRGRLRDVLGVRND